VSEQAVKDAKSKTPFEYDEQFVISVNVSNLEQSIDWYREALGFEVHYRMDHIGWAEVRTPWPGVNIGLSQTEEQRAGGTVPTFGVKDIDGARAHLESKGARFDGDTFDVEGMVKLAGFADPDGNPWMLAENVDSAYRK